MNNFKKYHFVKKDKNTIIAGGLILTFTFSFMETTQTVALRQMKLHSKIRWTYVQVLLGSLFCLTKLLNVEMVHNFEVMLEQTLNHSV
jgi:hypothetical protein